MPHSLSAQPHCDHSGTLVTALPKQWCTLYVEFAYRSDCLCACTCIYNLYIPQFAGCTQVRVADYPQITWTWGFCTSPLAQLSFELSGTAIQRTPSNFACAHHTTTLASYPSSPSSRARMTFEPSSKFLLLGSKVMHTFIACKEREPGYEVTTTQLGWQHTSQTQ